MPVTLPKKMPIAVGTKLSEIVFAYDELAPSSKTEINVLHDDESGNWWTGT